MFSYSLQICIQIYISIEHIKYWRDMFNYSLHICIQIYISIHIYHINLYMRLYISHIVCFITLIREVKRDELKIYVCHIRWIITLITHHILGHIYIWWYIKWHTEWFIIHKWLNVYIYIWLHTLNVSKFTIMYVICIYIYDYIYHTLCVSSRQYVMCDDHKMFPDTWPILNTYMIIHPM